MIHITDSLVIDDSAITLEFIRASGPGGQNVNKVESAVQLRFQAFQCEALSEEVRQRLIRLAGRRMSSDGVVVIEAKRFRTQERNRQDAFERLVSLLRRAVERPRARLKTHPSQGSRERRLEGKRRRAEIKRARRGVEE